MRWDDVRMFLAVAEAGSTLAASRRLGVNQTTVSRRIEERHGAPRDIVQAAGFDLVHYADRMARQIHPIRWLGQHLDMGRVRLRVSSVSGMVTALRAEEAIGLLPSVVGDNTPDLVPCFRHPELRHTCWIVTSAEAYARPLLRRCMKQIAEEFPREAFPASP